MKRSHHAQRHPISDDIFGAWVGVVALTASTTNPLPAGQRDRLVARLEAAYSDLAQSSAPSISSWRDCTDMINWLQSMTEMGWAEDKDGAIEDAKAALLQAERAYRSSGRLQLTVQSLDALRNCIDQLEEFSQQLSARSYWQVVKHTKDRVRRLLLGAKKAGDIVVAL